MNEITIKREVLINTGNYENTKIGITITREVAESGNEAYIADNMTKTAKQYLVSEALDVKRKARQ